jgi:hypothetical protein
MFTTFLSNHSSSYSLSPLPSPLSPFLFFSFSIVAGLNSDIQFISVPFFSLLPSTFRAFFALPTRPSSIHFIAPSLLPPFLGPPCPCPPPRSEGYSVMLSCYIYYTPDPRPTHTHTTRHRAVPLVLLAAKSWRSLRPLSRGHNN